MKFIFAIALLIMTFDAQAVKVVHECGRSQAGGLEYGWCIDRYPESKSKDVLYYMHGGGGSEESWQENRYLEDLNPIWEKLGFEIPTVITFSFGPSWLLSDLSVAGKPALLPLVLKNIMPTLEGKIGGVQGQRLIMGPSMGGYNGAELALRAPQGVFARAALLCPGLSIVDPFLPDEKIEEYIKSQPESTEPELIRDLVAWVRHDFQTSSIWDRHDPIKLATSTGPLKTTFYTSCTKDDEYAFFEGARKFAEILAGKTYAKFVPIESGGHCAESLTSIDALSRFMAGQR